MPQTPKTTRATRQGNQAVRERYANQSPPVSPKPDGGQSYRQPDQYTQRSGVTKRGEQDGNDESNPVASSFVAGRG